MRAAILDYDGTLVDTGRLMLRCYDAIADGLDCKRFWDDYASFIDLFDTDWKNNLVLMGIPEERHPEAVEIYLAARAAMEPEPFAYIDTALLTLNACGYALAIVSGTDAGELQATAERHYWPIDVCVGPIDGYLKPDPASIHRALELLGADSAESIAIGDSINDSLAAHKAGIPHLFTVMNGMTPPARLYREHEAQGLTVNYLSALDDIRGYLP